MNEGKAALARIVEGLGELDCFGGTWKFHHNPDNCGNYTVESAVVLGTICCLPKDSYKSAEKLQHIARCDPPAIRSIAAYVAELEAEVETLKRAAALSERLRGGIAMKFNTSRRHVKITRDF